MRQVTVPRNRYPVREFAGVVAAKALAMATIALAVVHSGLSPFMQALIIAAASATITGAFTLAAAWIAVKFAGKPIHEEVKATHEAVTAVADVAEEQRVEIAKLPGGRRAYDPPPNE